MLSQGIDAVGTAQRPLRLLAKSLSHGSADVRQGQLVQVRERPRVVADVQADERASDPLSRGSGV